MRLQEIFLVESTEEDRAIISLSHAIYSYLQKYTGEDIDPYSNVIHVGEIGQHFDTPLEGLNDVTIELHSDEGMRQRSKDPNTVSEPDKDSKKKIILGFWYSPDITIGFNIDYLTSNTMKTTIAHELRHALDDYKSDFKASSSEYYARPKNKAHRQVKKGLEGPADQNDNAEPEKRDLSYIAQPAEINARFLQVLHTIVPAVRRAVKLSPDQIMPSVLRDLKRSFEIFHIAELFPEKEKSKQYKQLMKRATDFIQKEIKYNQDT